MYAEDFLYQLFSPTSSPQQFDVEPFDALWDVNTSGIQCNNEENVELMLDEVFNTPEDDLLSKLFGEPGLTVSCYHRIKKAGNWIPSSVNFGREKQQTKLIRNARTPFETPLGIPGEARPRRPTPPKCGCIKKCLKRGKPI